MTNPLTADARRELDRIAARWAQLPLAVAQQAAAAVRDAAQDLVGAGAPALPNLGPGVVVDQLRVCAYDAASAGGDPTARLEALRRELP